MKKSINYENDYKLENGYYVNYCIICNHQFFGYKK